MNAKGVPQMAKERRNVFADVHGMPMPGAYAHLIGSSWTSADMLRRSLSLNMTRMLIKADRR